MTSISRQSRVSATQVARFSAQGLKCTSNRRFGAASLRTRLQMQEQLDWSSLRRALHSSRTFGHAGRPGRSVVASASALGAEDRRFESCRPDSVIESEGFAPQDHRGDAGVAQWQSPSLPSWPCEFDSRHPLHSVCPNGTAMAAFPACCCPSRLSVSTLFSLALCEVYD